MYIYVITRSINSDYQIIGATTNSDEAYDHVASLNEKYPPSFEGDEYRVEVYINGNLKSD